MYKPERRQEAKTINMDYAFVFTWGKFLFGDLGFRASPRGIHNEDRDREKKGNRYMCRCDEMMGWTKKRGLGERQKGEEGKRQDT
jgi:hypothetical protein